MYEGSTVAVVVPCHNEEKMVGRVIETMPDFVDHIYVIDDKSTDGTVEVVEKYLQRQPRRIKLIKHSTNEGVGGAIASGYKAGLVDSMNVTAVMAGDAQMAPDELSIIIEPVVRGECDYTKGNRLFSGDAWNMIPKVRYLGNAVLSLLTKIASGYWHVADSQSGYTAIGLNVLKTIDWDKMYKNYGQPNDLLVRLNIYNFRVRDIPITPVYGIGEKSGLRPLKVIPKISWLLCRLFFYRMVQKYVIRDFHPLLFFYMMSLVLIPVGGLFGLYLFIIRIFEGPVAVTSALFAVFLVVMGLQSLFFGMWLDMEYNKDLK
ncbi:MAG: glycosyltransferase family 2 protein [Gammaproteobacteria bacterium]|nr:glycosyltransferase family 2 protein [Gammaproteobacteria bacterium]